MIAASRNEDKYEQDFEVLLDKYPVPEEYDMLTDATTGPTGKKKNKKAAKTAAPRVL